MSARLSYLTFKVLFENSLLNAQSAQRDLKALLLCKAT